MVVVIWIFGFLNFIIAALLASGQPKFYFNIILFAWVVLGIWSWVEHIQDERLKNMLDNKE